MVWENALELIRSSIGERGYYLWNRSFTDFVKEYKIPAGQKAPFYLSLDFYSQQRPELTERGLYVIRFGQGNFGIFDKTVYPKPYLELKTEEAERISLTNYSSYEAMKKAFSIVDRDLSAAEDTLLEPCRFHGVFQKILEAFGESEYQIGPRGLFYSRFPLFFKRVNGDSTRFGYDGQVELDFSVWTENRVLVFEAKSLTRGGLDIGWHKLVFPSQRFASIGGEHLKINPVYFLRKRDSEGNRIMIYLFPEISFKEGGVVLNDEACWKPLRVWSVDLDSLRV